MADGVGRLCLSIFLLEFFTVFVPCWQAYRHKHLRQETLDMITAWEAKNPAGEGHSQDSSTSTIKAWTMASKLEKLGKRESFGSSYSGESLLSMGAMEYLLLNNPEPLRHFSALKDFSGENVSFLTAVAEWKRSYPAEEEDKEEATRDAYTRALRIYTDFISLRDADFPINLSFQDMAKLEALFEKAARILFGRHGIADHVTPFGGPPPPLHPLSSDDEDNDNASSSHHPIGHQRTSSNSRRPIVTAQDSATELRSMVRRIAYWGDIPAGFGRDVFDQAEAHVKYLVLTNTWPKFVQERRMSNESFVTLSGEEEAARNSSWAVRVSRVIACAK